MSSAAEVAAKLYTYLVEPTANVEAPKGVAEVVEADPEGVVFRIVAPF